MFTHPTTPGRRWQTRDFLLAQSVEVPAGYRRCGHVDDAGWHCRAIYAQVRFAHCYTHRKNRATHDGIIKITARSLHAQGLTAQQISRKLAVPVRTVRSWVSG